MRFLSRWMLATIRVTGAGSWVKARAEPRFPKKKPPACCEGRRGRQAVNKLPWAGRAGTFLPCRLPGSSPLACKHVVRGMGLPPSSPRGWERHRPTPATKPLPTLGVFPRQGFASRCAFIGWRGDVCCLCPLLPLGLVRSSEGGKDCCSDGVRVAPDHRGFHPYMPWACLQPSPVASVSGKFVGSKKLSKNLELSVSGLTKPSLRT